MEIFIMIRTSKCFLPVIALIFMCMANFSLAQQDSPTNESQKNPNVTPAQLALEKNVTFLNQKQKSLHEQLETLLQKKYRLQDGVRELREEIYKICSMSPENVVPAMLRMEGEIMAVQIEIEVKSVKNDVLAKQTNELTTMGEKEVETDQVVKDLQKLVQAREEALKVLKLQHSQGGAQSQDLMKAQADLVEARIRLQLRKEELYKNHGIADAVKLAQLIRENSVEMAQNQVRLHSLQNQYNRLRDARDKLEHYNNIIESELPRINRQIDRISDQILELDTSIDNIKNSATVN
jgi:hypothetical protein